MEKKSDLKLIADEFNSIVFYERTWMKHAKLESIPVAKIMHHFGAKNICEIYGCTIASDAIAVELIKEAFK